MVYYPPDNLDDIQDVIEINQYIDDTLTYWSSVIIERPKERFIEQAAEATGSDISIATAVIDGRWKELAWLFTDELDVESWLVSLGV